MKIKYKKERNGSYEIRYSDRAGSRNDAHQRCGCHHRYPGGGLEFYGKYKAKLSDELWEEIKDRKDGKLVLVTAINPTPAGEGNDDHYRGTGTGHGKAWPESHHRPQKSLPLALLWALRAELPEAGMPRWFPWRI